MTQAISELVVGMDLQAKMKEEPELSTSYQEMVLVQVIFFGRAD